MTAAAEIKLFGRTMGQVTFEERSDAAVFEYDPAFVDSGLQPAPLTMPLSRQLFSFAGLNAKTFYNLPGLLADSLPDKYGNAIFDVWLAREGRLPGSFSAIDRLCHLGIRGMGALEYVPATKGLGESTLLEIDKLVRLSSKILSTHSSIVRPFEDGAAEETLPDLLKVGTSAGGARAKAVIAWNPKSNEVRSGQVDAPPGFEQWLIKFDGVTENRDKETVDPCGFSAVEYAYYRMARDAGISISESRLLEAGGLRHFMTRRFDREAGGKKLHMQSLGAIAHFDFNLAGAYSYEQAMQVIQRIGALPEDKEELFRRMVFNIAGRNQDDHVKNIAFLMDRFGRWRLSPAFDVTFSFNPKGAWTAVHQMTLGGKRDGFTFDDFKAFEKTASLKQNATERIIEEVLSVVSRWRDYADEAKVPPLWRDQIWRRLRLRF